jgi:hypothetical protein
MFLVPQVTPPVTLAQMSSWWASYALTGDNQREKPYADLYSRLTTKSNTFTVHMRVQALRQVASGRSGSSAWANWNEGKDVITSEYRGSQTVERYVDPNDPRIPDFTSGANDSATGVPSNQEALDAYYKFRVLHTDPFSQ